MRVSTIHRGVGRWLPANRSRSALEGLPQQGVGRSFLHVRLILGGPGSAGRVGASQQVICGDTQQDRGRHRHRPARDLRQLAEDTLPAEQLQSRQPFLKVFFTSLSLTHALYLFTWLKCQSGIRQQSIKWPMLLFNLCMHIDLQVS